MTQIYQNKIEFPTKIEKNDKKAVFLPCFLRFFDYFILFLKANNEETPMTPSLSSAPIPEASTEQVP